MGYEKRFAGLLFGFAGGYTRAKVDVDDLAADFDADVMNLALYSAYLHESGIFARAGLGFSYAWNDYDVAMALGPNKGASYKSHAYTANLDLGYVYNTYFVNVIPSVGLYYTHNRQEGFQEYGGELGSRGFFGKTHANMVDIPVQVRLNKVFDVGGVQIAPEVRMAWIYAAKKNNSTIDYGLAGSSQTYGVQGVNPGRNRARIGGGLKTQWCGKYEAGVDYDYEWRSKYKDHRLTATFAVSF